MLAQAALLNISGDEEDIRYQFYKNKTLHLPYANQPVQTLDGRELPFDAVCGIDDTMILVLPKDVEQHLGGFNAQFTLAARVDSEMELASAIFDFLNKVKFE